MTSTGHSLSRPSERRQKARQIVASLLAELAASPPPDSAQLYEQNRELMPEFEQEWRKAQRVRAALEAAASPDRSDELCDSLSNETTESLFDTEVEQLPERVGRYQVEGLIGEGGFGRVYLGWDSELDRHVAIKTPHRDRLSNPEAIATYLAEARLLAKLDHSGIVPVYDAGRTSDGGCYLVSKWVDGIDLSARLRQSRLTSDEAVRIVVDVATALHYAHARGIVHRDIKPANILLDRQERCCLADFGLASRDVADEPANEQWAGTPSYMSPEQARGESHRVDCRSDIFSLGVVLYEAVTGRRPFEGATRDELLERIISQDPSPLRQWDHTVPPELDRICQKMLAKRAADRYATARELAQDLRHLLWQDSSTTRPLDRSLPSEQTSHPATATNARAARIVPKGLRAFDAEDAAFFLDLLPGPRDRQGVPENLRRWKRRIENLDEDETFAVGLLYGPSGCGKSSFVRAGLLPMLAPHVETVYVEASPDGSEAQLLKRLQKCLPDLPVELGLTKCLAAIRRGFGLREGHKLLLVVDQFEQWLSGRDDRGRRSLVEAFRQCDGVHLQCLLLVRDDFWLAVSRFMSDLEAELLQGRNTALVDLFDPQHARKVLIDLGRAYDRLPIHEPLTEAQSEFLDAAVAGLTEDAMIIPVRLALFVEIIKNRPWTLETLRSLGGAQGVGVTFLEESFCARTANPKNRAHEAAARAVLEALLPRPGIPIKGHVRSYPELLDLSGYGNRPREFKELMRILDGETRLLTPADLILDPSESNPAIPLVRYYQLTHDYLVPSLREWLTKKHRATASGRAALRLAERSALWNTTRERRQLPSLWEWFTIRCYTRPHSWTESQQRMMRTATRRHALLSASWLAAALLFLVVGAELTTSARSLFMQIRAATVPVWLAFGQDQALFPLLQSNPDPTLRARLIHRLSPLLINFEQLVMRATEPHDPSVRRALLLAAGEMLADTAEDAATSVNMQRRPIKEQLLRSLVDLYQRDPDPGIHSAAEWTLRRYQQSSDLTSFDASVDPTTPQSEQQWQLSTERHTMVIVPGPVRFVMGDAYSRNTPPRSELIRRSFAIATKEVTVEQFRRFVAMTNSDNVNLRGAWLSQSLQAHSPDIPAIGVTWYQAAAYCNWLSERERIPKDQWCFLPNSDGQYAEGMSIASDWLNRRGYRLPSEAEWEFCCRAGATTPWPSGGDASLLSSYAQYNAETRGPLPVGTLMPNDLGLFDMLGNAAEWCLETHSFPIWGVSAGKIDLVVENKSARVVRGGSFSANELETSNGARSGMLPAQPALSVGFRVARSY